MEKMAYSFHVGSDKNKKNSVRKSASKNISNSTSMSNNAIQNASQLKKCDKHNLRKYDELQDDIVIIKGTKDLTKDVKDLYMQEFEESRLAYNEKQIRNARKIDDYFTNISDNSKNDLAVEIIVELGDKKYWDTKDINFKKRMTNVYKEQVSDLENLIPNFKIANSIIHYDETSPHLHIVGVPVKEKNKYGMEIQVGKSDVFTRDSLKIIQDKMRTMCIESFNKEYELSNTLKEKLKGRNKDYHVSEMDNYQQMKDELEKNQEKLEQVTDKSFELNKKTKEIHSTIDNLKQSLINKDNYIITTEDKNKITDYLDQVDETNDKVKEIYKLSVSLENVSNEMADDKKEIQILTENNQALELRNKTLNSTLTKKDKEIKELKEENKGLKELALFWKSKLNNFVSFFKKRILGKEDERESTMDIVDEMYDERLITNDNYTDLRQSYFKARNREKRGKEKNMDDDFEI